MVIKNEKMKIKVNKNGPYTVTGGIPLSDQIMILYQITFDMEILKIVEYIFCKVVNG